ncbi:conserved hypothetical protein [Theileria orientalis strain Shintoku]|uniref:Uncharacterized protein n=1 Tax=Theileria orientalis strain Shintoku TaxID=869250 RepID=J7MEG6_THEOR|nr:conserved hypothetical protein [Theileria orientalis strain Shintoku]BAM38549.1 conserved hypothetical protein [Theileria orientalis strain Shintoku]|eukprot:XP_009688850.1 conserved hypothetical protein [Theileria orientalis strain Shintoku]
MLSFCSTCALLYLLVNNGLVSDCFIHNSGIPSSKHELSSDKWSLFATKSKLKAVRKFTRDRPKKTRPSAIYPSPTIYYGNVHNHFGAPPEYLAIPVEKTLNILRNGRLSELISMMKRGITGSELSEALSDKPFFSALSDEVSAIKQISEYEACDVSSDLHQYFESILRSPLDYENYVDKFYTVKKLQSYWENRERMLYNLTFKRLFARLKSVAHKLNEAGTPLSEFADPKLWHRYGVFKMVPNCKMAENYLEKHKIALSFDIRSLYYRDVNTNQIKSNFDKFYAELGLKDGATAHTLGEHLTDSTDTQTGINGTASTDTQTGVNGTDATDTQTGVNGAGSTEGGFNLYPDRPGSQETGFSLDEKGRLPGELVDRIVSDLAALGVLDPNAPWSINLSRIDELQEGFASQQAQHAYAIRDFYLSLKYPGYRVESDPYVLGALIPSLYTTYYAYTFYLLSLFLKLLLISI